jgi:glycosyltransferase involved in cell wall biosynthesis
MISILIATYNSGKTIRKCLDSLLDQKLQDWECILIDGASKDDTIRIIEEYERKDSRFRHISEPDNGIYDALNKGFKLAKGEWAYVLGSDDWLTNDGLYNLLCGAEVDSSAVYGNIIVAYNNGVNRVIKPKKLRKIRYYMPISHQGVIVKLDEIKKLGGFDLRYIVKGDFNMMQALYLKGVKFQYINTEVNYSGMEGLSNKISSIVKYDWERYLINTRNHANSIPFLSWCWIEFKTIAVSIRDKFLGRK